MKKLSYSVMFMLFISTKLFSQSGEVIYEMKYYNTPVKEAKLYFEGDKSLFIFDKITVEEQLSKSNYTRQADGAYVKSKKTGDSVGTIVYKTTNPNRIISREIMASNPYLINEDLTPIDWKLGTETKKIEGFECQKANATFRGREYEVWFTSDVLVVAGPWKLWGVPGLILEAYDKTQEIGFYFKSIAINKSVKEFLKEPTQGKSVTRNEFKAKKIEAREKAEQMLQTYADKGIKVDLKSNARKSIEVENN
jgi:GLPGLI family protein